MTDERFRLGAPPVSRITALLGVMLFMFLASMLPIERAAAQETFSFAVTTDMRNFAGPGTYNTSSYFRGVMEAVKARGGGAFMIVPGDLDPPANVEWTIEQVMGAGYMWYPVVGNHELEALENMAWMRSYDYYRNGSGAPPDIVNWGPTGCTQTTYSFDYGNAHFAVLNQYCDSGGDVVTDGKVPDHLYDWLAADLRATNKEHIFVAGHEPAYPQPDADNGRSRHVGDSLDRYPANRDRFWNLLKSEGVTAYLTAHTHNYSAVRIDGVWQLDAGHARGTGDTGAASTFLMIHVNGSKVTFDAYRDVHDGNYDYDDIVHSGTLKGGDTSITLPGHCHGIPGPSASSQRGHQYPG